jgi:hypothetical protein
MRQKLAFVSMVKKAKQALKKSGFILTVPQKGIMK